MTASNVHFRFILFYFLLSVPRLVSLVPDFQRNAVFDVQVYKILNILTTLPDTCKKGDLLKVIKLHCRYKPFHMHFMIVCTCLR